MSLRPFFTYYGGKWRAALRYPAPRFRTICEPFAGSAGYSLRYADMRVFLVDVSPVICGVWDFLIRASEADVLALPDLDATERVDNLRVCQEARWLIGFWVQAGVARPRQTFSTWARRYRETRKTQFWGPGVRQRIASQQASIRHWQVRQGTYADCNPCEVTWFVDPPYNNNAGNTYPYGPSSIDYNHLGAWCRVLAGQVIVCENTGADWLPFEDFGRVKSNQANSGSKTSREAIWVNG